jgi:hypothetical protein
VSTRSTAKPNVLGCSLAGQIVDLSAVWACELKHHQREVKA